MNPIEAVNPSSLVKSNYGFVNSEALVSTFKSQGWDLVSSQAVRTRKLERLGYQKHLMRFENKAISSIEGLNVNNTSKPQLVVINSHDGSTSLQILWGLIRIACANGIIAGTSISSVRFRHSQNVMEQLPVGIQTLMDNAPTFFNSIVQLSNKTFTPNAVEELVKQAYDKRLEGVGKLLSVNYRLPDVKRSEDAGNDAYTIYNRIQEVVMRGGIEFVAERKYKGETRTVSTASRKVTNIQEQIKLNSFLYDKAIELAA